MGEARERHAWREWEPQEKIKDELHLHHVKGVDDPI